MSKWLVVGNKEKRKRAKECHGGHRYGDSKKMILTREGRLLFCDCCPLRQQIFHVSKEEEEAGPRMAEMSVDFLLCKLKAFDAQLGTSQRSKMNFKNQRYSKLWKDFR